MPADALYLCGASPPFSYSNQFMAIHGRSNDFYTNSCSVLNSQTFSRAPRLPLSTLKPCLKLIQQTETICGCDVQNFRFERNGIAEKTQKDSIIPEASRVVKKGKKVTFADTRGRTLTYIKYLTESTNEPPKSFISGDLDRESITSLHMKASSADCKKSEDVPKIELKFDQPVADYMNFQQKINSNNVSLENLAINDNAEMNGTVKVKNIAFDKLVFVRITFNNWKTHEDIKCDYVKNAYENGKFDTFQFNIGIPDFCAIEESCNVQLCICYKCNGAEYWDNNNGENYVISCVVSSSSQTKHSLPIDIPFRSTFENRLSFPSTYTELPGAQDCTWLNMEGAGPFY